MLASPTFRHILNDGDVSLVLIPVLAFISGTFYAVAVYWLGGGLLGSQSVRALGRFMVVEIEVRSDHQLVTHGPYARIRHPMYTALLLLESNQRASLGE